MKAIILLLFPSYNFLTHLLSVPRNLPHSKQVILITLGFADQPDPACPDCDLCTTFDAPGYGKVKDGFWERNLLIVQFVGSS